MKHTFEGQLKVQKQTHDISKNGRKEVHAFYYPRMVHWGKERGETFDYKAKWVEHIQKAKEAGITGFLVSHFDDTDREHYSQLVQLGARVGFKINPYMELWSMRSDLRSFWEEMVWLRETHSPDMFAVFVSNQLPNHVWETIKDRITQGIPIIGGNPHDEHFEGLEVLDGCHIYNPAKWSLDDMDKFYHLIAESVRFCEPDMGWGKKLWCATVMPGFDESSMPERENPIILPRNRGETYRTFWDAAIASDPDMIFITSALEIPEKSNILECEDEELYLGITKEKIAEWRE